MKTTRQKFFLAALALLMGCAAQISSAFYNSEIGRWANRDPLGGEGSVSLVLRPYHVPLILILATESTKPGELLVGLNLFTFVDNNPVNAVDPLGLSSIHAQVLSAIARGDVVALESLLATGTLNAAQAALVRAALSKLNSTAVQWIARNCKGSIAREFPSQYYRATLASIKSAAQAGNKAAQKAWKLLNSGEYQK